MVMAILSVPVPVVRVGVVRMAVRHGCVAVRMVVPHACGDRGGVVVRVMRVMAMPMRMFRFRVMVLVNMAFRKVQPDAERHEDAGGDQWWGQGLTEEGHGAGGAEEWRYAEIGARPRGSKAAQRDNEEREAEPVGEEAEQ